MQTKNKTYKIKEYFEKFGINNHEDFQTILLDNDIRIKLNSSKFLQGVQKEIVSYIPEKKF